MPARHSTHRPSLPVMVAATLAAGWVLLQLGAPIVEDSLFWWVPKALLAAERGPHLVLAGELPRALGAGPFPHQWAGGIPDYAHPPLWYWWLGLFLFISPTVQSVHLATLLPAVLLAAGFARLGAHTGARWSGLAVLCLPPVLSQLLRPELDLPLLALTPWALLALIEGRWTRFALLGLLAPWLKEPGVLLVVPAVLRAAQERRWRLAALSPLLGLGAWAILHGGLAQPERLPADPGAYARDAWTATRIVLIEQGRWLLLAGLPWAWRRTSSKVLASFSLVWLLFFAAVGFFATRGGLQPLTHVRYFVPGMAVGAVLLTARWPWLALPGLAWLLARSPYGPEASLWGVDAGRAERQAAPWIRAQVEQGAAVWVGSYQGAGLTQPWAGRVQAPVSGLHLYGPDTLPGDVPDGAILLTAAYGEPAGRLQHGLALDPLDQWRSGSATVRAWRVRSHTETRLR